MSGPQKKLIRVHPEDLAPIPQNEEVISYLLWVHIVHCTATHSLKFTGDFDIWRWWALQPTQARGHGTHLQRQQKPAAACPAAAATAAAAAQAVEDSGGATQDHRK